MEKDQAEVSTLKNRVMQLETELLVARSHMKMMEQKAMEKVQDTLSRVSVMDLFLQHIISCRTMHREPDIYFIWICDEYK